jgi:hypothetical protein
MSRNEIRLRRHRTTASGADRFRNYSDVLQRHERDKKVRKIIRVFMMFMIILIVIALIFFLWRIESGDLPFEKSTPNAPSTHSSTSVRDSPSML